MNLIGRRTTGFQAAEFFFWSILTLICSQESSFSAAVAKPMQFENVYGPSLRQHSKKSMQGSLSCSICHQPVPITAPYCKDRGHQFHQTCYNSLAEEEKKFTNCRICQREKTEQTLVTTAAKQRIQDLLEEHNPNPVSSDEPDDPQ
ncbi:hypothetical protein PGT21_018883 [Puccinia graminis f. sp. tritici]|uniref:RING-type domain-containing protein n=2 Tax=Puccinia graminis f. sp. tritici TaxID=56615 RepID=A0A5B0NJI6_PUCGR|nr:hypothetical protein PGT21_018883 [Puccinia graminis f. sp. tritici]